VSILRFGPRRGGGHAGRLTTVVLRFYLTRGGGISSTTCHHDRGKLCLICDFTACRGKHGSALAGVWHSPPSNGRGAGASGGGAGGGRDGGAVTPGEKNIGAPKGGQGGRSAGGSAFRQPRTGLFKNAKSHRGGAGPGLNGFFFGCAGIRGRSRRVSLGPSTALPRNARDAGFGPSPGHQPIIDSRCGCGGTRGAAFARGVVRGIAARAAGAPEGPGTGASGGGGRFWAGSQEFPGPDGWPIGGGKSRASGGLGAFKRFSRVGDGARTRWAGAEGDGARGAGQRRAPRD